jgi:hypothetical protein
MKNLIQFFQLKSTLHKFLASFFGLIITFSMSPGAFADELSSVIYSSDTNAPYDSLSYTQFEFTLVNDLPENGFIKIYVPDTFEGDGGDYTWDVDSFTGNGSIDYSSNISAVRLINEGSSKVIMIATEGVTIPGGTTLNIQLNNYVITGNPPSSGSYPIKIETYELGDLIWGEFFDNTYWQENSGNWNGSAWAGIDVGGAYELFLSTPDDGSNDWNKFFRPEAMRLTYTGGPLDGGQWSDSVMLQMGSGGQLIFETSSVSSLTV